MELFHKHQTEPVNDTWNDVKDGLPKEKSCKVGVMTDDGNRFYAYYYEDMGRLQRYMNYTAHFWCCENHQPILNVTHWIGLK